MVRETNGMYLTQLNPFKNVCDLAAKRMGIIINVKITTSISHFIFCANDYIISDNLNKRG